MSIFPDRKSLTKECSVDGHEFDVEISQLEEQKVFTWIRIYLNEEIEIEKGSDINITYTPTNEEVTVKFLSYNKSFSNKNMDDISKYSDEEDKKVLCCMIDLNIINQNSEDIPFLRTLFKSSRWHRDQIYRRSDMLVTYDNGCQEDGYLNTKIDYFHIDF